MGSGRIEESVSAIDLAREAPFALGAMKVTPASLKVVQGEEAQTLEPRVMQVLVALARRRGEVVSRDELMAAGWGERVVGEDALYRCIIKVRKLGEKTGAFSMENVRRVGYQLDETPAHGKTEDPRMPRRRHRLAVGGLAAVVGLLGLIAAAWSFLERPHPGWQNGRVWVRALEARNPDPSLHSLSEAMGDAIVRALAASGVETAVEDKGNPAEFLISGTVNRDGDDYATYVQIFDRRTSAVLWSKRFDRSEAELAGYPEQVA
ncbi:MAG TPA: winged helix-turn-helix domain-containing protein, partial [Caulobacteraceae bacterium]|nr:winged helix-turn-helix domain-containing protein [Caulobacteraceae bacterium]